MMKDYYSLAVHPDHLPHAVESIRVNVWADGNGWRLRYLVDGASEVVLPHETSPGRADDLWKATCFEAFVGTGRDAYREYNFASSGQWATYAFDGPRSGMRAACDTAEVWLEGGDDWIAVEAAVSADLASGSPVGLAAVIEEVGGVKSYWALAHPDGPPDFHNRDCFVARLPPVTAP